MKNRFLLLVLTALIAFCGCSKSDGDDNNGSNGLIGKWEAVEEVNEPDYSHLDYQYEAGELIIEFTNDRYKSYYEGEQEFSVAYSYNNGTLTVMGVDMKVEITSNQLKIHEKSIDVEPIESYTLYRKID